VSPAEVVAAVLGRGVTVLGADAGLVALVTRDGREIEIVGTSGYGPRTTDKWGRFPVDGPYPLSDVVRGGKSIYLGDRADWDVKYPALQGEVEDAFQASVALPLAARQRVFGALHFSFTSVRDFTDTDRDFLDELSHQCALAIERALLLEELETARADAEVARASAEAARSRQEFLARASVLLAESLDYQTTLESIARLAVPDLCDWAAVDMVDAESGRILHLALAHKDPDEVQWVREAQRRYPVYMTQVGQPEVQAISTGRTVFLPDLPEEVVLAAAQDEEHLRLIRRLDLHSLLCVPLTARGGTHGAVLFATVRASGRTFTPETVELVEELATPCRRRGRERAVFQSVENSEERYRTLFETASLGSCTRTARRRSSTPTPPHSASWA
jgi:GAF domain-containing protein